MDVLAFLIAAPTDQQACRGFYNLRYRHFERTGGYRALVNFTSRNYSPAHPFFATNEGKRLQVHYETCN